MEQGKVLHKLIQTDYFRVVVVDDKDTVEMCGALKVSCAKNLVQKMLLKKPLYFRTLSAVPPVSWMGWEWVITQRRL